MIAFAPHSSRTIRGYDAAGFRFGTYEGTEEQIARSHQEIAPGVTRFTFDARAIAGADM